jgi:hypothetical protein
MFGQPGGDPRGELCEWFQADNQGRGGEDAPIGGCAMQGRVCHAVQKGKMATDVTAEWSTESVCGRVVSKSEAEWRIWVDEILSSGMSAVSLYCGRRERAKTSARSRRPVSSPNGRPNPIRSSPTSAPWPPLAWRWASARSCSTNLPRALRPTRYVDGPYYALLEGRFRFDFVHEEKLAPGYSGHTDLSRLLRNSIRWVAGENQPVTIAGDGLIESFAWETPAGFAIHVLNYTNPAVHRGWVREFYPIGEQRVQMQLSEGRKVSRVELLRAANPIPRGRWRDHFHYSQGR